MKRPLLWLLVTAIAFSTGAIGGAVGFWWLQHFLSRPISATGVLKYQNASTAGESVPPPEGYYIQSSAVDRVYISSGSVNQYLGQDVMARGKLSTICGADSIPCYPLIQAESINVAPR